MTNEYTYFHLISFEIMDFATLRFAGCVNPGPSSQIFRRHSILISLEDDFDNDFIKKKHSRCFAVPHRQTHIYQTMCCYTVLFAALYSSPHLLSPPWEPDDFGIINRGPNFHHSHTHN